jgi:hypothetical protein
MIEHWWLYMKKEAKKHIYVLPVTCHVISCAAMGLCQQETITRYGLLTLDQNCDPE